MPNTQSPNKISNNNLFIYDNKHLVNKTCHMINPTKLQLMELRLKLEFHPWFEINEKYIVILIIMFNKLSSLEDISYIIV